MAWHKDLQTIKNNQTTIAENPNPKINDNTSLKTLVILNT